MNPEQQRIAIAEACGLTESEWVCANGEWCFTDQVPDYLNELNAMHEAEADALDTPAKQADFWDTLHRVVFGREFWGDDTTSNVCFDLMHATAAQRAEAFLKTLNLWKDND